mgnify:CR=1 FL=1
MKNFLQAGAAITVATAGAKVSGNLYFAGDLKGIAGHSAAGSEDCVLHLVGVYELPKQTGQAWTVGAVIYWDDANSVCTTDDNTGANKLAGHATAVALTADALGNVRLSN